MFNYFIPYLTFFKLYFFIKIQFYVRQNIDKGLNKNQ